MCKIYIRKTFSMKIRYIILICAAIAMMMFACSGSNSKPSSSSDEYGFRHITAAAERDKFCGWPANGGAWAWGDEIVVLFKQGVMKLKIRGHLIDSDIPETNVQARSIDGGETWTLERDLHLEIDGTLPVKTLTEPIDFAHKDFALVFLKTSVSEGKTYFFLSSDRCKTWDGPYELPLFGEAFISARTCTLTEGQHEMLAFVSGAPKEGDELGTHVFLIRTKDGGMNWEKVSDVGPVSDQTKWYIMPCVVRISEKEIICGLRYCDESNGEQEGLEIWASTDNGQTWEFRHRLASGSNPATLEYHDDRLILFYGNRIEPPLGIHARISRDKGKTWSQPIIVRDDAGSFDLGYPKNVYRNDGKGILFYYYTLLDPEADRTIEATIWDPEKLK